ncbi:tRNA 2-thiouridine(34) synthase MnmA [Patescibacteria group bacterium]|nr:tRNA 2-thiouridine(34) synthase MnmA [Patescibacteria group bacterium]
MNLFKKKIKIAVAMSGGVDSSVAAALLVKQGYDVIGVFMHFWLETSKDELSSDEFANRRRSLEAEKTARGVCEKIGIPLYTLNAAREFKKAVVDYFLSELKKGATPNPCVVCNKEIKFKLLLEKAESFGADGVATGHYARKLKVKSEKLKVEYHLLKARDKNKDQSYFLYNLTQSQLAKYLFPIGDYLKTDVRKMAKKFNLPAWNRPESQEICFISDNDIKRFIGAHLDLTPGKILDKSGKVIGRHAGLPLFTIGQRHGMGIGGGAPYYAVKMDYKTRELIVTSNPKDKMLYRDSLIAENVNWISGKMILETVKCKATIRYRHKPEEAIIKPLSDGKCEVVFAAPQRAAAPGQSVVFYRRNEVLGGGVIGKL